MRHYGLIGWPLGHSFSKQYFREKFEREGILDACYDLFPLENIAELPALLAHYPDLCGLNVTIPHKELVIPWLDALDETARVVGAVNCIRITKDRKLTGYNTDVTGFENSLLNSGFMQDSKAESALILGTGGASKAVAYVLKKLGILYKFVSRKPVAEDEISYDSLNHPPFGLQPPTLLVNTTPLGTFPRLEEMPPLPLNIFYPGLFVYDLIYNPAETLLLREARFRGCKLKNGLEMLELQAEAAWEIWQKTFDP